MPNIEYFTKELKQFLNKKCNISTVFYSPFKLRKIIKVNKDKCKRLENKDSVYKLECNKYEACLGQTKRLIGTRSKEHKDT